MLVTGTLNVTSVVVCAQCCMHSSHYCTQSWSDEHRPNLLVQHLTVCWLLSLHSTLQSSRTVPKPHQWEGQVFSLAAVHSWLGKRDGRSWRVHSSALTIWLSCLLPDSSSEWNGCYCWAIQSCDGSLVLLHKRQKNKKGKLVSHGKTSQTSNLCYISWPA